MKRIFTLLLVMSALVVNAQTIKIFYGGSELNNNDTVYVPISGQDDEINTYLGYQNTSSSNIEFRVRKELLLLDEEGSIDFCLGDCYTGNLSAPISMRADETVAEDAETAMHVIYAGSSQPALVKFTFFLTSNESDQISFYVSYGASSAVKESDIVKILRAYPNPASRVVTIDYVAPSANSYLVIKNLTGKEVYRAAVGAAGGKQIDVTAFTAGVYLYGIESDGKMVCTKKLLVK